jgi:hypothetical protein
VEKTTCGLGKAVELRDQGIHSLQGGSNRHDTKVTIPTVGVSDFNPVTGFRSEDPIQDIESLRATVSLEGDVKRGGDVGLEVVSVFGGGTRSDQLPKIVRDRPVGGEESLQGIECRSMGDIELEGGLVLPRAKSGLTRLVDQDEGIRLLLQVEAVEVLTCPPTVGMPVQ